MPAPLAFALAFLPGLLWLRFLHAKDRIEPEPSSIVLRVFALGCGSAYLVLLVRADVDLLLLADLTGLRAHLADAFVATALLEEVAKILAFAAGAWWHRELDEPTDGIVYGMAAGLGFASIENFYFLTSTGDPWSVAARGFTATLLHAALSGALGFGFGMARLGRFRWRPIALGVLALAYATLAHGAYDLFLFAYPRFSLVSLVGLLPVLLAVLGQLIAWSQAHARAHASADSIPCATASRTS